MHGNQKITDPKELEARRVRKAQARKHYDEARKMNKFMLSTYVPKSWKEDGLGVAMRDLIAAHIAAARATGKRKISIVKTIKAETERVSASIAKKK